MEKWSAQLDNFKINFFLDTNILCFLIDNTYPALTAFIKVLAQMPVVRLFSSEYVLAELFEVRKKENYFQEVLRRAKSDGKFINISSFIKYNKRYEIPDYHYEGRLAEAVRHLVDNDIDKIMREFSISFENIFNERLLQPMKGICLSTKISREDSLVLASSVYKSSTDKVSGRVILITGDLDFYNWVIDSKKDISNIFHEVSIPDIEHIAHFGNRVNLRGQTENVDKIAIQYVLDRLKETFSNSYIGDIVLRNCPKPPKNLIAIKTSKQLPNTDSYLAIISKDLSFIYCPQSKSEFYHCGSPIKVPFNPTEGKDIITFVCEDIEEGVFNRVNTKGNLVFRHPDMDML